MTLDLKQGKNTDEADVTIDITASDTPAKVKAAFYTWLLNSCVKNRRPENIITFWNQVSELLIHRKLSHVPLWEITSSDIFESVYAKVINDKLFRTVNKRTYTSFVQIGKLYYKFLKSKPVLHEAVASTVDSPSQPNSQLTIKEAVILVLEAEQCSMTAEQIYNKIVADGLYSFGALNPQNVVRNIIDYACKGSNYTRRAAKDIFGYELNSQGKMVYFLLAANSVDDTTQNTAANEVETPEPLKIEIWNDSIGQQFQAWLRSEYSQSTARNYYSAANRTYQNFKQLAEDAASKTNTLSDAIRKFIALLNQDNGFLATNFAAHNQLTASLAALERFITSCKKTENDINHKPVKSAIETNNAPTALLDDIIDLDEGRNGIREILSTHFKTLYGYSNISILWNAAQNSLSMFLNDNAINTADDLWRFMCRAFAGEYVLSSPHIWQTIPDYPQSFVGVIINLARQNGGMVTREQIDDYFSRIKQNAPINATIIRQNLLLFCTSKKFIVTEALSLTSECCSEITKALHKLFSGEHASHIILRDISEEWFSRLPEIKGGLPWTALLLQEVLRIRPNIGYRVIFSGIDGQSLDTLGAAIAPDRSEIATFADVVHCYCYEKNLLSQRMLAEDLRLIIRDAGMLEGNELIYNLHKALKDYRFAFTDENRTVKILER